MNKNKLTEYQNLRNETMSYISLQNSLNMFGITTSIAIFALSSEKLPFYPYVYLTPYLVIIPIMCRIIRYSKYINKISAYLVVFLEKGDSDIRWERANRFYAENNYHKSTNYFIENIINIIKNYDFLFISLLSDFLFYYTYFNLNKRNYFYFIDIVWIIIPIIFTLLVTFFIHYQKYMTKEKGLEINKWNNILKKNLDKMTKNN